MQHLLKYFILSSLLIFTITTSYAQEDALFKNAHSALKASNSKELAKYFNENIELNINGERSSFSSVHAEIYLKDFFKKYPPLDFEYGHQGSSGDLKYAIGSYSCSDGSFRVIIRSRPFNGTYKIYMLDFHKE